MSEEQTTATIQPRPADAGIVLARPRCPYCGSTDVVAYCHRPDHRYYTCRRCFHPVTSKPTTFKAIMV